MEVVFAVGQFYDPRPIPLIAVTPRYLPYPRLHRWIIFPFECKTLDYCLVLVGGVTLG